MSEADVRIIPLGVGEAFTARNYTTCLALGAGDAWMLLDCPHPVRKMLREGSHAAGIPLDLDRISGVALSHLHADHCSGLEDYGFYSKYALGRRARVLAHPEVSAKLWNGLLTAGMGELRDPSGAPPVIKRLDEYFDVTALSESHPTPSARSRSGAGQHDPPDPDHRLPDPRPDRLFGFSGDTAFDPPLIDWLTPCDLIVHEVTTFHASTVHTPYDRLAALPASLRARMRLNHYPDDFDADSSAIEILHQGRIYPV